jgi:hypothetical protein
VSKDTIVDGRIARKLVRFNSSGAVSGEEIVHARNDSVFYWYQGQFNLMSDFHSALGDTTVLEIRSTALSSFTDTVLDVSVVITDKKDSLVNGKLLKFVEVAVVPISGLENEYVWPLTYQYFEQIGHNYSGVEIVYEIKLPGIPEQSNLRCFDNFIDLSYQTPFWNLHGGNTYACDYILANPRISAGVNPIEIFPNPAKAVIYFSRSTDSRLKEKVEISIFDLKGKLLIEDLLERGVQQKELNISSLEQGAYIVQLQVGREVSKKRLIVQ